MELVKPKDRLNIPIKGTEKRDLPRFIDRGDLTFFVRYFSEGGAIPIAEELNGMRISFGGQSLSPQQRKAFFKHAQLWQDLLLAESGRETFKSDSTNQVAQHRSHGRISRDSSSNTPSNSPHITIHL